MNGSGVHHHRREEEARSTPVTNYTAPTVQQQPEPTPKAAPKAPTPQPAPVEEKIEEFVEPLTEPEPAAPVEPPPTKRAPAERVAPAPYVCYFFIFSLISLLSENKNFNLLFSVGASRA